MIILDTNVVSELMRATPDETVVGWVHNRRLQLWTTSITLAEIHYGVERLPAGRRKDQIAGAADRVFGMFSERILPFDAKTAHSYSLLAADRDRAGLPIDGFDGQIAAICRVHDASVATRNVKDFAGTGVEVIDPWLTS